MLLLKIMVIKNARNAMCKLLQDFLVQIQQIDSHVAFLPWYSSNKNSSEVPTERPEDVYKYFQALQTYSTCLNPKQHTKQHKKQHTKQQPMYASIFLC